MVEGDVPGAGQVPFLEDDAGVKAPESFCHRVPCGLHRQDMRHYFMALVEVLMAPGAVFVSGRNDAAADVAEPGLGAGFEKGGGAGAGMRGHYGWYWREG